MKPVRFRSLFTVWVFARLNTRRFFRDRMAMFFGIVFPVIFLFVFGGIFGHGSGSVSFRIALIDNSGTAFGRNFETQLASNKVFKVDKAATTLAAAHTDMGRGQLDAAVVLPPGFGRAGAAGYPTGQVQVVYTQNNTQAGQTLTALLQSQLKAINARLAPAPAPPLSVVAMPTSQKSLTPFDYIFAGLLGFTIIGLGIFGPINVFPELKKQGVLRRLHTTPLKVWQYFVATVISQAAVGLVSLAVLFAVSIVVFHLKVIGSYVDIVGYLILSIVTILGIGLAIGGWARNERQAAPLANMVVFPMMFLSGTFFPRFLMPVWLQHVSAYLPLTPVIDGIRLITTEGKTFTNLGPQLALMGAWIVIVYWLAFRLFRWE